MPLDANKLTMTAPQAFNGINTQIGAEVASIIYANFSRETR